MLLLFSIITPWLNENNIKLQKVPANLTYLFQPLDVQGGPNGHSKSFMEKKFTLWYTDQVKNELDKGKKIEEIDISMKLSILKPLHAKWLTDLYNYMTSPDGQAVSLKRWGVAGITEAVQKDLNGLPSLDLFHDIDPLSFTPNAEENTSKMTMMRRMKINGRCIFTKAKKRILARKSGLTQTDLFERRLLIYLKLTRTGSISLRL